MAAKGAKATPDPSVATEIVVVLLVNKPDGPLAGAVKVTITPTDGVFKESLTVTPSGRGNAVEVGVVCGVLPGFAVIVGGKVDELVNEKVAWVAIPLTLANTL